MKIIIIGTDFDKDCIQKQMLVKSNHEDIITPLVKVPEINKKYKGHERPYKFHK